MAAFTIKAVYTGRVALRRRPAQNPLFQNPYQKHRGSHAAGHSQRVNQIGKRHNSTSTDTNSTSSPSSSLPSPSSNPTTTPPPASQQPSISPKSTTVSSTPAPTPTPTSSSASSTAAAAAAAAAVTAGGGAAKTARTKPSIWQRLGPITHGINFYTRWQSKRPYATQFVTTLLIFSAGDFGAQQISDEPYDPTRTARAMIIASGSAIPNYRWFLYLGTLWNITGRPILSLSAKIVTNQLVFTPVFNSYFFAMQHILSTLQNHFFPSWAPASSSSSADPAHRDHHHQSSLSLLHLATSTFEHVIRTVPTSFINSWKLWPAVTAVNFSYVLPQYRSIFAGFVFLWWQVYLSWLNRRVERVEEHEEEVREGELERKESSVVEAVGTVGGKRLQQQA